MALFIQQNDGRSKLQERLAQELSEKAKKRAQAEADLPDGVEDSKYIQDTKTTTSLAWVWVVIIIFVIAAFITYIVGSSK